MTFEQTHNRYGREIIKDDERNIHLERIAGRAGAGEGYLYEFTYKEKKYACE